MTRQEIYVKVRDCLLKQKAKSTHIGVNDYGVTFRECAYRGDNGMQCAIGCLISDALYTPEMEGRNVSYLCDNSYLKPPSDATLALLCSLQYVHDQTPPETWPQGLVALAERHGLEP